jgi:hypothetical protein
MSIAATNFLCGRHWYQLDTARYICTSTQVLILTIGMIRDYDPLPYRPILHRIATFPSSEIFARVYIHRLVHGVLALE